MSLVAPTGTAKSREQQRHPRRQHPSRRRHEHTQQLVLLVLLVIAPPQLLAEPLALQLPQFTRLLAPSLAAGSDAAAVFAALDADGDGALGERELVALQDWQPGGRLVSGGGADADAVGGGGGGGVALSRGEFAAKLESGLLRQGVSASALFARLDRDGDGWLTPAEAAAGREAIRESTSAAAEVSAEAFARRAGGRLKAGTDAALAFKLLDDDNSGGLSAPELRNVDVYLERRAGKARMSRMSRHLFEKRYPGRRFDTADEDGDGYLAHAEVQRFVQQLGGREL